MAATTLLAGAIPQQPQLPGRLKIDLIRAISIMRPWTRARVDPSLMHVLSTWSTAALHAATKAGAGASSSQHELSPKQTAMLSFVMDQLGHAVRQG